MKQLDLSQFESKITGRSDANMDHLQRLREANRNNPEFRAKCSESKKGELNHMYGKTHTAEAREKIRAHRIGTKFDQASKDKRHKTMLERYGKRAVGPTRHTFEGLTCQDWLDKNRDLVESLTYQRGKRTERHKVLEHMIALCPTATKKYLTVQICNWSKKNA